MQHVQMCQKMVVIVVSRVARTVVTRLTDVLYSSSSSAERRWTNVRGWAWPETRRQSISAVLDLVVLLLLTVKPVLFACPLFRNLGNRVKITGR